MVEEREARIQLLRAKIEESIERGGSYSDNDIGTAIDARMEHLAQEEP